MDADGTLLGLVRARAARSWCPPHREQVVGRWAAYIACSCRSGERGEARGTEAEMDHDPDRDGPRRATPSERSSAASPWGWRSASGGSASLRARVQRRFFGWPCRALPAIRSAAPGGGNDGVDGATRRWARRGQRRGGGLRPRALLPLARTPPGGLESSDVGDAPYRRATDCSS